MYLPDSSAGQELLLKHRRVILEVSVKGASPSTSVRHASDVPGAVFLATQGVDDAASEDDGCNFGTLENNNAGASTMGVMVSGSKALGGKVRKLYSVSVTEVTSTAGTVSSSLKGDSTTGITADGNVAFTVTGTAANLDSDTVTYRVTLECQIEADKSA